jgi:copper chaperone CopZ
MQFRCRLPGAAAETASEENGDEIMTEYTMHIGGMMCGMCESHMNDAIRKLDPKAKKVSSSHKKGVSKFRSELSFDEEALRAAVEATGYHFNGVDTKEI